MHYFSESIRERSKNGINVFLIGNKLDYNEYRQVSIEDGLNYAIRNGYYFYETSCKNNTNIQIVFQKLIEETVKKKELEDDENGIDNLILTRKVIKPQKNFLLINKFEKNIILIVQVKLLLKN